MEQDISIWQKPGHFYFALTVEHSRTPDTCNLVPQKPTMTTHLPSRSWFRDQITSIRNALRTSDIKGINTGVDKLKEGLDQV